MAEKKHQLLKVSLLLYAIGMLGNGVIYLFFPEWEIESSGSVAFPVGWIRWVGAFFIAIGIGSFMAFRNPEKQGIFVTTLCILTFLNGLILIYTVLFEYEEMGNMLRSLIPAIIILIMSLLFFISLKKSKEILW
jgi:FtsH-binding integral membrane protein